MFSVDEAVDYLVHIKFGLLASMYTSLTILDKDKNSESHKKLAEIEAYKNSLRSMPLEDLEHLFLETRKQTQARLEQRKKQAMLDEEQAERDRFYNLKSASADFIHWSKAAHWTLDEAIALSFGKEPDVVSWNKIEKFKDKSPFVKTYAKRRDLALRARWKAFGNTIPPAIFISWAKQIKLDLPIELINELLKIGVAAIDWREKFNALETAHNELLENSKNAKLGTTQKTENLLKAFASIAIDAYGYDPASKKSTTTNDILKALERQGKTLDPKTIRAWLKEGIELLPSKPL